MATVITLEKPVERFGDTRGVLRPRDLNCLGNNKMAAKLGSWIDKGHALFCFGFLSCERTRAPPPFELTLHLLIITSLGCEQLSINDTGQESPVNIYFLSTRSVPTSLPDRSSKRSPSTDCVLSAIDKADLSVYQPRADTR